MTRRSMTDEPANHVCEECGQHQASMWWIGEGGTLAISRFYMQAAWCECCALKVQVTYAEERARELNGLYEKLATVECKEAVQKESGVDPI